MKFLALPIYPTLSRMIATTDREGHPAHFLAEEPRYLAVRDLQSNDRLIPVVADLAGTKGLTALADTLRKRGLTISVFYVSDVEFFLIRSGQFDAYLANLKRLPWSKGALVVRTSTREIDHPARFPGDHSTTAMERVESFLERTDAGQVRTADDLFA
jgi:hypothetical protein